MEQRTWMQLEEIRKNMEAQETKKEKEKKRILILSLGTGSILGGEALQMSAEQKREKLAKKEYFYQSATYYFDNKEVTTKTEFVAQPLMEKFRPDEVFIIGTSKSAWTAFYGKFGEDDDKKDETIAKLFELEEKGGKGIDIEEAKEYTQKIESWFQAGIRGGCFSNVKIHVIVTRYGLNGEELLENYCLIRDAFGSVLNRGKADCIYEVAFDITHSFRSMPIYNLVILNYLRNISQINLELAHIYYGNIEVRYENGGLSPIVDLEELANVLALSDSVSEFKNTGNAVSLINCIPDTEEELKNTLKAFDWATQINDYNAVIASFRKLIKICAQKNDERSGKYVDLREMILVVIKDKFFGDKRMTNMPDMRAEPLKILNTMPRAEIQYRLSRWYYNQNRYGQALATGLEALGSYLVPMYLEYTGKEVNKREKNNKKNREAAIERMKELVKMYEGKHFRPTGKGEKTAEIFRELEYWRNIVQPIRNTFAHNLERQRSSADSSAEAGRNQKDCIDKFFMALGQFVEWIQQDRDAVCALYMAEYREQ